MFIRPDGTHTDQPSLVCIEITQTNYPHPTITSGMHTNGPSSLWFRHVGAEWECAGRMTMHIARERWVAGGIDALRADAKARQ